MGQLAGDDTQAGRKRPAGAFQAEDGEHRPLASQSPRIAADPDAAGAFQAEDGEHLRRAP
jgi:hypothetical protein